MRRNPLNTMSLIEIIKDMTEDNVSAASIIDELIQNKGENNALAILIILDDMNIRGVQIYNLYKMCDQKIDKFYEKVINIKEEDIKELNFNTFAICKYKALYNGTSKDRSLNIEKY